MLSVVTLMRKAATVLNHRLMFQRGIWQCMLDLSFGGLSSPPATLAILFSRFCWKRLRRNLGMITMARSRSLVRLRPSSISSSAWRTILMITLSIAQFLNRSLFFLFLA
ncbi:hypothetical protein PTKIN_Ptkin19aG0092300 [Pterospermum kingtungense]